MIIIIISKWGRYYHHHFLLNLLLHHCLTQSLSQLLPSQTALLEHARIVVLFIALLSVLLTYWGQYVHHNSVAKSFSTAFFMNLVYLILMKLVANDAHSEVLFNTLTGVSLLQFIGLVSYKLASSAKCKRRVMAFLISKSQREAAVDDLWQMSMSEVWSL